VWYIAMLLDFLDDQKRGANEAFLGWVRGEPSTRAIDHMRSALPALYEVIQRRRNAWWAHRIDELLAGGTHLIVIGMNHMLGPDGIPRQPAAAQLAVNEVGA
jgi:uncharacterized protein YbaP (TraB family)